MNAATHILSGRCVGNVFRFTARERAFCMIAASAADVDAVSRIFGEEAYSRPIWIGGWWRGYGEGWLEGAYIGLGSA